MNLTEGQLLSMIHNDKNKSQRMEWKVPDERLAMIEAMKEAVEWIEDDRFGDDYIQESWYHKMKELLANSR